jgi:hypothetical protein
MSFSVWLLCELFCVFVVLYVYVIRVFVWCPVVMTLIEKTNSVALSPQGNYTE